MNPSAFDNHYAVFSCFGTYLYAPERSIPFTTPLNVAASGVYQISRYRAYGKPLQTEHQQWKEKHDELWEDLCWRIEDGCFLTQVQLTQSQHVFS